jgi:ubiquinone/menaquinone biosynthesis C-methylase UbiE
MLAALAPKPSDRILDIGCGTGSLALAIKTLEPRATVVGIDPDEEALGIARAKAHRAGLVVDLRQGFAVEHEKEQRTTYSKITCSLVLHHVALEEKHRIVRAAYQMLRPGGSAVIADYDRQRSTMMRFAFRNTVQRLDGRQTTQPHVNGILADILHSAGFEDISEIGDTTSLTGSIAVYVSAKKGTSPSAKCIDISPGNAPLKPAVRNLGEKPTR